MAELDKEIRGKTFGYISAALGLVAGLAWNDAIKSMIESLFPLSRDTVAVKFLYAILVTMAVIIIIKYMEKILSRQDG